MPRPCRLARVPRSPSAPLARRPNGQGGCLGGRPGQQDNHVRRFVCQPAKLTPPFAATGVTACYQPALAVGSPLDHPTDWNPRAPCSLPRTSLPSHVGAQRTHRRQISRSGPSGHSFYLPRPVDAPRDPDPVESVLSRGRPGAVHVPDLAAPSATIISCRRHFIYSISGPGSEDRKPGPPLSPCLVCIPLHGCL